MADLDFYCKVLLPCSFVSHTLTFQLGCIKICITNKISQTPDRSWKHKVM